MKNKVLITLLSLALSTFAYAVGDAKKGEKLFGKSGGNCVACHDVNGQTLEQPGMLGPKLTGLKYWPAEQLYARLWDPTKVNPISAMPPFGANAILTEDQLQDLVAYLQTIE